MRKYDSNCSQGPWLLSGACGIMLVMKKVAELSGMVAVRSPDGVMCPRSKPEPV